MNSKLIYQERLNALRKVMKRKRVAACIIPSSDPHVSEYLPEHYKCISFMCGFTGSAGTVVITEDFAGLWTDSRYFEQAEEQLQDTGFSLVKLNVQHAPEYIGWLKNHLKSGETIGYDSWLVSFAIDELLLQLELNGILLKRDFTPIDEIWESRPPLPTAPAFCLESSLVEKNLNQKLEDVRAEMRKLNAEAHIISTLDDIAWLFNIRGSDVECNPVVLAFAVVTDSEAMLFVDRRKFTSEDLSSLKDLSVQVKPYEEFSEYVQHIPNSKILLDPKRSSSKLKYMLPEHASILLHQNPTTTFKAIKGPVEISNTREVMQKDGVALVRFFKWLEETSQKEIITEVSAAEKLESFRRLEEGFIGNSFATIAAYAAHGSLPHYHPDPNHETVLEPRGLFLLDSGGQYVKGTTDVTRVHPMGELTEEEKTDYTLVLKGMIEGSTVIFPKGSRGYQIDAITRKPLWDHLRDYGHGTGHGVGYFLNVHEGPQVFNKANLAVDIELGMITSVEPGIYRSGKHGVRIENLVLTIPHSKSEFAEFYSFETLTLAPIATTPVIKGLFEQRHIDWLNGYNKRVYETLKHLLSKAEQDWLQSKTRPL